MKLRHLWVFALFFSPSLLALSASSEELPDVARRAIELKKTADALNIRDINRLQRSILRLLRRNNEAKLSSQHFQQAITKLKKDKEILNQTLDSETWEPKLFNRLKSFEKRLSMAEESLNHYPEDILNPSIAMNLVREQGPGITRTKIMLMYLLGTTSPESQLDIQNLSLKSTETIGEDLHEKLLELLFYSASHRILWIPNSGYVHDAPWSSEPFQGVGILGFTYHCLGTTAVRHLEEKDKNDLKVGDLITGDGVSMVVIEDTQITENNKEVYVIQATSSQNAQGRAIEGIVADRISMSFLDDVYYAVFREK